MVRRTSIPILRILTDRGTEYKGNIEHHAFELFLSIEGIEHTVTKAYSPQTNGICERFHKTMKNEFYDTAMRKKIYNSLFELSLSERLCKYDIRISPSLIDIFPFLVISTTKYGKLI